MMARRMTITKKKNVISNSSRRNSCWSPLADISTSAEQRGEGNEENDKCIIMKLLTNAATRTKASIQVENKALLKKKIDIEELF